MAKSRPHRIVIIDDDEHFIELLSYHLKKAGHLVEDISSLKAIEPGIVDFRPDLVICDLVMPIPGMEILEQVKENPRMHQVPFIFISAHDDHERKIKAYLGGADDFLIKPLHIPELLAKVTGILRRQDNIRKDIYRDPLSNLYNRRFLELEMPRQLSFHQRHKENLVVGILDIDHFKKVNDTYGHLVGDIIIENFAKAIVDQVRASDYVVRYGGEEFVVLFIRAERQGAINTLERLLQRLRKAPLYSNPTQNIEVKITFSAGLAEFPTHGTDGKTILRLADQAMYVAKESGRNQVRVAEPV